MRVIALCILASVSASGCLQKTQCKASCAPFFSDLQQLDWQGTLRKASLSIAGRLPNSFEREVVTKDGQAGLEAVLDQQMREDPFYTRLNEIYNDLFLTDQYLGNGDMIIDPDRFPNRQFFQDFSEDQMTANKDGTDYGIAREPLNIITHVVREDRSFKEILTAPYTLVNAYSAKAYGLDGVSFVGNVGDRNNLVETKLPGIPSAGILTTAAWLNAFPTSATNRNRHRSRFVYLYFLDVDVLGFGQRPISVSAIDSNTPTMTNPDCTPCHTYVDPVAGTFQNWNDMGVYSPPEKGWYTDMFQPGYASEPFKAGKQEGLQWLGQRLASQEGFVRATVKTMFKGFTGQTPQGAPAESDSPEGAAAQNAFDAQTAVFAEIGQRFKDSNYNLKTVVKNIILSPYFRATDINPAADPSRDLDYANIGMARFLTPEMLNRKIGAVLALDRYWGQPGSLQNTQYLDSTDFYLIYYGGIDSVATQTRITAPNGVSVNVARRMSNQLACQAVALDFAESKDKRALMPYVELNTTVDSNDGAIRQNIQYLHDRLLGEAVNNGDDEMERTHQLFLDTFTDLQTAGDPKLPSDCQGNQDHWTGATMKGGPTSDPNYTVRSWMAVVSYMLGDYKFLHE